MTLEHVNNEKSIRMRIMMGMDYPPALTLERDPTRRHKGNTQGSRPGRQSTAPIPMGTGWAVERDVVVNKLWNISES